MTMAFQLSYGVADEIEIKIKRGDIE